MSVVFSVRIPKRLKKLMDRFKNVDWVGEVRAFINRRVRKLGKWVSDSWYAGHSMHTCFYEAWCTQEDVEEALERVRKLVEEIKKKIQAENNLRGNQS